ncbi:family 16 glycosylhydrolase [Rufibacter aurantiacus]|uniref:family 16 glycosylhydrolase n=1 Tax=Rufibacter aurantiacus TaxID=2817374 RepID=UPI001B304E53|nr:family 16 glycosylhydrolase [Rufibacter aurantiacus]
MIHHYYAFLFKSKSLKKTIGSLGLLLALSPSGQAQTVVWEENFDGPTINTNNWTFEVGDGCNRNLCGWGNAELQYYTDRPENARIENGNLVIEARREAFQTRQFTSARLKTEGKVQFKYGTVEARIKVPDLQNGLWPALWTLGTVGGVWPAIGEIDILEMGIREAIQAGLTNRRVGAAVHWEHNNSQADYGTHYDTPANLNNDYHTYKMVWTSQFIRIYVDNHEFFAFNTAGAAGSDLEEFHNPHFLVLNLAVGGNYPGITNPSGITAPLPAKMYVDYIKLYQNAGDDISTGQEPISAAGNYGIYTETTQTLSKLSYTNDANLYLWEGTLSQITVPAPVSFEGTEVIAVKETGGKGWYGFGIANKPKNLSAFAANGSLRFHMKTTAPGTLKVGIKSGEVESWVNIPETGDQFGLVRDGNWHQVSIPLSRFMTVSGFNLNNVNQSFMVASVTPPPAGAELFFDNIYYNPGPLGVKEDAELKASVRLYPNPTSSELRFSASKNLDGNTLVIMDLAGREVMKTRVKGNKVNVQALPAGLYMLTLEHNGKVTYKRFIKN